LAFFNLTKGDQWATAAQKEKKWLAHKRNCTSCRERQKVAEEAVTGVLQHKCEWCRHKFASCKNMKHHWCPVAKGASWGEVGGKGKGKTVTNPKPNKPGPTLPPNPSTSKPTPHTTTTLLGAKKKRHRVPSSIRAATLATTPSDMMDEAFHSSTPHFGDALTHKLERFNTSKKHRIWRGLMESVKAHDHIPSWTLTTTITIFPMMSSPPPPSSTSSSPSLSGLFDASISDADFGHLARERAWALLAARGFDQEEPLPSSLTRWQELSPHSQEFSPTWVFNESPSHMLTTTTPTGVTPVRGAPPTLDPSQIPIGSRLAKKRSLPEHAKLSVFNILNIFWHCWFISVDHLRTTVLLAQKAKDGKISWVEFTP
jgi:hypothetical protein